MEAELKDIEQFVKSLVSFDQIHYPAYYDDELRIKTEELSEKFNAKIFIETGSFDGRNPPILNEVGIFDAIHTIEIQEEFYNTFVLPNNKDLKNVFCHLGDSVEVLDKILSEISESDRCTIFLDAHGFELPLVKEMEIIAKYCKKTPPIIMVHDFFVPSDHNPNQPKFPVNLADGNNTIITVDYLKDYLDAIYGKDNFVVEYATKSDLPNGGTGVVYFYPIS